MIKEMIKKGIFLLLIMIGQNLFAQNFKENIVYLKNGSVLRGVSLVNMADSAIKLKLFNGNEMYILKNDISEIKRARIKKHQLFENEKELHKAFLTANINSVIAIHTSFGNTKTISNQLLLDLGIRFKNHFALSVGAGIVNYSNLNPNQSKLINGKNEYSINSSNSLSSSSSLMHIMSYLNFSVPLINLKKMRIEQFIKGGYFIYTPGNYYTSITNNGYDYKLGFNSEYLQRPFFNAGLNYVFNTPKDKVKITLGIGYYVDFMQINYNYEEVKDVRTISGRYWSVVNYTQKTNAHLHMVTTNLGIRF
jgi:hypothetical protein